MMLRKVKTSIFTKNLRLEKKQAVPNVATKFYYHKIPVAYL